MQTLVLVDDPGIYLHVIILCLPGYLYVCLNKLANAVERQGKANKSITCHFMGKQVLISILAF